MISIPSRGRLDLELNGRTIRLQGEGFRQGPVDFVVSGAQIHHWNDGAEVTDDERKAILDHLFTCAAEKGLNIEID
ncbi:Imm74 family immunity protein [Amycolatopsis sp. GM8]|uniref:Imm74 family immunity protein n=1 Tax=Amycolatopsis sp. GM8 TaxID=2896530 RepID=UPI001EED1E45|nr:Imm74 family immunity protein [Amycolatopsis sp. GM8]